MALAPYNEILTILNTANNLFSALENRFTQKRFNKIMRDEQLSIIKPELEKIETMLKMRAVGDLTRIAFEELKLTAAQFGNTVQNDPTLVRVYYQMLQWQAQLFMRTIEAFNHGNFVNPQHFLT